MANVIGLSGEDHPRWETSVNLDEPVPAIDVFWSWLRSGWKYRECNKMPKKDRDLYVERVKYEAEVMIEKDFIDYFLILSDAVRATKDAGVVVGPARGSAAASLVCYLLRIIEVNPMLYPMMLVERFIDPNRMDLPDVDLDFEAARRDYVRQHLITRYGEDRVGNIGTFTRYRGKNSIDDVARVYSLPKADVARAKDFLVERSGGDSRFDATISDTVEQFPVVKEVFDKYPQLYRTLELEGNIKGMGVHAAGLVVGSGPLNDILATYTRTVGEGDKAKVLQVMSVDKYDGEHLGLLKIDALGLTTMGMIGICLREIGMSLEELYKIPLDDRITLDAFKIADVVGVFQFEGRTTKMVCQEVAPDSFLELADINALSRPGPLHSGQTGEYIAIKHGRGEAESLHPFIDELTKTTHGQIIYQEQILSITREIGQFPWVHAATIRKVISQKKGEAAFNVLGEDFIKGAATQGVNEFLADKIWKKMVTAGSYAFNIAHCISYAQLGYWCMYLKQHHPVAFYAATLQKTDMDEKKRRHIALMRDAQDERFGRDIQIRPPHFKTSGATWRPNVAENAVEAGLEQVRGIAGKTSHAILEHRDKEGLESWDELIAVKGIGVKTIEMITSFAEKVDPFGLNRLKDGERDIKRSLRSGEIRAYFPNTMADQVPYIDKRSEHILLGIVRARNPQDLFENHRSRTGNELDPRDVRDPELKDSMTLYMEDSSGQMTVRVNRWLYPKIKDALWGLRLNRDFILFEATKLPHYGKTVHMKSMCVIDPDDDDFDEELE